MLLSPLRRGGRAAAAAGFVALALTGPLSAQDAPAPGAAAPRPTPGAAADAGPPFLVTGVVITPARRSAMLVVLDESRRQAGVVTVREGESYEGYRLAAVEESGVVLERNGTQFPMVVGRPWEDPGPPAIEPAPASATPARSRRPPRPSTTSWIGCSATRSSSSGSTRGAR
jgi:type II secretory pathway component PulC